MNLFSRHEKDFRDNPTFIRLIQVCRDDPTFAQNLVKILKLNAFNRQQAIQSWITSMETTKAPDELIKAMQSLLVDEVAEVVLKLVTGEIQPD